MSDDPRFVRSSEALRAAVLALAAERPVESLAVADIARAAGVTRATFYNHADSPEQLLARAVETGLDRVRREFLEAVTDTTDLMTSWRASEHALISHVLTHEQVYRTGLTPTPEGHGTALASILSRHFEATLLAYAGGVRPLDELTADDRTRLAMEAAFTSHGLVGALRAWLLSPEPRHAAFAVEAIIEATPRYWFTLADSIGA